MTASTFIPSFVAEFHQNKKVDRKKQLHRQTNRLLNLQLSNDFLFNLCCMPTVSVTFDIPVHVADKIHFSKHGEPCARVSVLSFVTQNGSFTAYNHYWTQFGGYLVPYHVHEMDATIFYFICWSFINATIAISKFARCTSVWAYGYEFLFIDLNNLLV